jgi:hypothetical protein
MKRRAGIQDWDRGSGKGKAEDESVGNGLTDFIGVDTGHPAGLDLYGIREAVFGDIPRKSGIRNIEQAVDQVHGEVSF